MQPDQFPDVLAIDQRHLESLVMRLRSDRIDPPRPMRNANLSNYEGQFISDRPYDLVKNVAVLPLRGFLGKRGWWCDTAFDEFSALVRFATKDPAVETILIDCHSPGGSTYGCADCADVVYEANRQKRVVCCINDLCASAALWVASAARQIVITQSADVGSIGVYMMRMDATEALKKQGISMEVIRAGEQKAWGSPYLPMTDPERKTWQAQVNATYDSFIAAVARNRHVSPDKVRSQWADARVFNAQQALENGLADYIGSFEGVLSALGIRPMAAAESPRALAAAPPPAPPPAQPVTRRLARQYIQTITMPNGQKVQRIITR